MTPSTAAPGSESPPSRSARCGCAALPLGRPGNAHEIAAWIAFLCSPDARYANGSSFVVDGGLVLMGPEANRKLAQS